MIFRYPISFAIRQHAPYNMLHALYVPSVHNLLISQVRPSSRNRLTGRPHTAQPISCSPSYNPTENLWPTVALWWRWKWLIKSLACLNVIGLISVLFHSLRQLNANSGVQTATIIPPDTMPKPHYRTSYPIVVLGTASTPCHTRLRILPCLPPMP